MPVSFQKDIVPLFTQTDISHMKGMGVLLNDYAYMSNPAGDATYKDHANANHVYGHIAGTEQPQMPMNGPYWTATPQGQANLKTLLNWMTVAPAYQP